jgi:two-component system sensor kinase FixL
MEIQLVLLNLLSNASMRSNPRARTANAQRRSWRRNAMEWSSFRCATTAAASNRALERIFQPFYSSKHKGMGLGLSFSRALVERNGGRLSAIRNSNTGMTLNYRCARKTRRRTCAGRYCHWHRAASIRSITEERNDERNAANGMYRR